MSKIPLKGKKCISETTGNGKAEKMLSNTRLCLSTKQNLYLIFY